MPDQLSYEEEDEHHVIIFKNDHGQFYVPAWNFNSIPYWDHTEGYQLKVDADVEAVWEGERIPFDADIPLQAGWNIVPYFPTYQLNPNRDDFYALSPIIDNVILAKDAEGNFIHPGGWGFPWMPFWRPGQAYLVKVDEDVVLNYPEEPEEEVAGVEPNPSALKPLKGSNMSVLIINSDLNQCDNILAYSTNDYLVGNGVVDGDGRCGLAVWGDDASMNKVDGKAEGESIRLQLHCESSIHESELVPATFFEGTSLTYTANDLLVLQVQAEYSPMQNYELLAAYPNPFNSTIRIDYNLNEQESVTLDIFDLSGRLIENLISDESQKTGNHSTMWTPYTNSSGIYIVSFKGGDKSYKKKIVYMR